MSRDFTITACPTCGSRRIERICGKWSGSYRGKNYEVAGVEYYSCPACGEKVYPPEAMRRIREASPGFTRRVVPPQRRSGHETNTRTLG